MAFDQSTRNRLQRFVNDARKVLQEEFIRQLQNDYGLDPISGSITGLENLRHLNDAQRETARILRDTLSHYCASGDMDGKQALDRIVREQAFTVLNRLAALRMAEARGLLVESVGSGFQAKGFQLYGRLSGTGLGETAEAYRIYLFSVFDELAQELPGLFYRFSPQGRLFPRESALLPLLNLINSDDIEPLWSEDETIGWIYQYFNSKEERKSMRDASPAPRNSRELAVRNQFFTPRYVVEFLVDNTLGRLWFNATGGKTTLRDRCQYLLVKPDETPVVGTKLRDPRTLKLLDPACGSMHFGLYAFDLFIEIYREAWIWEQQYGPGALDLSTSPQAGFQPLSLTYTDEGEYLRDVPRLIIEHNIYGVDIDPRAVQIASLALWLRAQRAWHDTGVKAKDRPLIGVGHVVAAVAPPAELELRQQLTASMDKRDAVLFEKTLQLLKGLPELGVLLQVERELPKLIREVYGGGKEEDLFTAQDKGIWEKAEIRLREALTDFATAAKSTYQGRLFAQDALQGLRLIDLCSEVFDVVVMNPPFGDTSSSTVDYLDYATPDWCKNLAAAFIVRMKMLLRSGACIGCVTDKTILIKSSYESFRQSCALGEATIGPLADLGWGVLDAANVEVTAAVFSCDGDIDSTQGFIDCRNDNNKDVRLIGAIRHQVDIRWLAPAIFNRIPHASIAYDIPNFVLNFFSSLPPLQASGARALQGHAIKMDWYGRLWWEVDPHSIDVNGRWTRMYNGGPFSRFGMPSVEIARWNEDGLFLKHHPSTRWSNSEYQHLPGIGYGKRGEVLDAHVVPVGHVFTVEGLFVLPESFDDIWYYLGVLNAPLTSVILNLYCGQHKHAGYVNLLPIPAPLPNLPTHVTVANISRAGFQLRLKIEHLNELSGYFSGLLASAVEAGAKYFDVRLAFTQQIGFQIKALERDLAVAVEALYGISKIDRDCISHQLDKYLGGGELNEQYGFLQQVGGGREAAAELFSYLVGATFLRWSINATFSGQPVEASFDPRLPIPSQSPAMSRVTHENTVSFLSEVDLESRIQSCMSSIFGHNSEGVEVQMLSLLGVGSEIEYLRNHVGFFSDHLAKYSKGRKQAPIYWPFGTTSGLYTLWVYYPSLTSQTLYTATNDFVEPKLKQVGDDVTALRNKGSARTSKDEKQFESLQAFELELIELRDTLLKLAPTYKPNLDDGVQISAAPLWPLFRHKPWQKVLKETWEKLEKGDYDWAHLAINYWPERVRLKCKTDKSLAIAHGLEELYIEPVGKVKKVRNKKNAGVDK